MASCCRRPIRQMYAALICSVLLPLCAAKSQDTVFVDHRARKIVYHAAEVEPGDEIRARSQTVPVRVTNTNSALYVCDLTDELAKVPEIEALKGFAKVLGPYATGLALIETSRSAIPSDEEALADSANRLKSVLDSIDAALTGARGIERARARTIATLELMRPDTALPERLASALRRALEADEACLPGCSRLTAVTQLAMMYPRLAILLHAIETRRKRIPEGRALLRQTSASFTSGQEALREQGDVMALAYQTSALVDRVAHAASVVECRSVKPSGTEGRSVAVRITPRDVVETRRVADREPLSVQFTVQPERAIRAALSGGFLYAPGQTYPKFAARETGETTEVASAGTLDQRFDFGLVLSLTHRALDHRAEKRVTWWPLDVVANPSGRIQSIGAGTSLSYRAVRVGVGHLWTRHEELGGQVVGQVLGSAEDLNVRDTYRPPHNRWKGFYFSMGITGVPPFVPGAE